MPERATGQLVKRYAVIVAKVILLVVAGIALTVFLDHIPTAE